MRLLEPTSNSPRVITPNRWAEAAVGERPEPRQSVVAQAPRRETTVCRYFASFSYRAQSWQNPAGRSEGRMAPQ